MKRSQYHRQSIKRHYSGQLRGLSHSQLYRQRGLWCVKLGPASRGRRLTDDERKAVEQKMREDGRL